MQVFVVFGVNPSQSVQETVVKAAFPNDHLIIDNTTCLVACNGMTVKQLADTLGMGDERSQAGIVSTLDTYWGRHNSNTWEWISVKMQSP
jgi:hypothetical protein